MGLRTHARVLKLNIKQKASVLGLSSRGSDYMNSVSSEPSLDRLLCLAFQIAQRNRNCSQFTELGRLVSLFPAALAPGRSWVTMDTRAGQTEGKSYARGQAKDQPVLICWADPGICLQEL